MFSFILKASEEVCTCFIVLSETRGFDVSTFGMGLMRLPTQADGKIDRAEAIAMIRYALDHGVNYLDTAYPYHGGESELVLAEALKDGYRQKAIVVSKSPTWLLKEPADYDRLLDEQLEKLGVDYLDVYLLHSLGEGELRHRPEDGIQQGLHPAGQGRGQNQVRRLLLPRRF